MPESAVRKPNELVTAELGPLGPCSVELLARHRSDGGHLTDAGSRGFRCCRRRVFDRFGKRGIGFRRRAIGPRINWDIELRRIFDDANGLNATGR
ncbi:MAG: hypothetical protein AAFY46_09125, partial [Planctomycetota bacterium]